MTPRTTTYKWKSMIIGASNSLFENNHSNKHLQNKQIQELVETRFLKCS